MKVLINDEECVWIEDGVAKCDYSCYNDRENEMIVAAVNRAINKRTQEVEVLKRWLTLNKKERNKNG